MKCRYSTSKAIHSSSYGLLWGYISKLKRSLRIHDSSTNINIFILLSSLTAPGRPNHAYSINKRHAQCSQVSVSIHTHPQIPWQKLFVFTRACKRDRQEKKHWDKDRGRRERCKKSWRTNPLQKKIHFLQQYIAHGWASLRCVWVKPTFYLKRLNPGSSISL